MKILNLRLNGLWTGGGKTDIIFYFELVTDYNHNHLVFRFLRER